MAKDIVVDATDDAELRPACLNTLHQLGDTDRVYGDTDFVNRVQEVGDDESAPHVARIARALLDERPDR